jgi:hypothetical protein
MADSKMVSGNCRTPGFLLPAECALGEIEELAKLAYVLDDIRPMKIVVEVSAGAPKCQFESNTQSVEIQPRRLLRGR